MDSAQNLQSEEEAQEFEELSVSQMLESCFLFHGVEAANLEVIAQQLESQKFKKGEPIFLENEINDTVYFVKNGAVELVHYVPELKRVNRIAVLPPGAHFSEFAVLNHAQKSASAFAYEDCELMALKGEAFLQILNKMPTIAQQLCATLSKINQQMSQKQVSVEDYRSFPHEFHRDIPQLIPMVQWEKLKILPLNYKAGTLTIATTTPQDARLYNRLRTTNPSLHLVVSIIAESEYKHELEEFKKLYKPKKVVQDLVPRRAKKKEDAGQEFELSSFLTSASLFKFLGEQILQQIVPYFEGEEYKEGQMIFKPGEESEHLFVIAEGEVLITKPLNDFPADIHLVNLHVGDSFGEMTLLNNTPHLHSARAMAKTKLIKMPKSVFQQLLAAPSFSVPVARILAKRLQVMNEKHGISIYEGDGNFEAEKLAHLLPLSIIEQQKVLPMMMENDELVVGIVSSENETIYSVISRYLLDYRIRLVLITDEQFHAWSTKIKGLKGDDQSNIAPNLRAQVAPAIDASAPGLGDDAVKLYKEILAEAFSKNASDLHIEPFPEAFNIRYRIDGVLIERQEKVPPAIGQAIVNKIKVVSELDISEKNLPQDGQLAEEINGVPIKARVSTVPTKHGENAVLRLIRQKGAVIPLNMLAPDRRTISCLQHVTQFKQGLFLITGPTGSGKTTTLYSMLNELNSVDINIITLENPVEMNIDGITQIEMDDKKGLNFEKSLRSVLRQDPDVVMVGEIRDAESAEIVFHAAMTGHLVLSTLHTNNSLEVFGRLQEMGVSTSNLAAGMIGAVAQRLVRANCKRCRRFEPITEEEKRIIETELNVPAPAELMKSSGCPACHGSGYIGRLPVYEIWRKTQELQVVLAESGSVVEQLAAARKDGFLTMREFGLRMVLNGLTTVAEIKRCLAT